MNDQQCLPDAAESAVRTEGSSGGLHSPARAAGASRRVRHSPSTPLIGSYNGRRWWSLSSTNVWCSTSDHSDFDHLSRGTLVHMAKAIASDRFIETSGTLCVQCSLFLVNGFTGNKGKGKMEHSLLGYKNSLKIALTMHMIT